MTERSNGGMAGGGTNRRPLYATPAATDTADMSPKGSASAHNSQTMTPKLHTSAFSEYASRRNTSGAVHWQVPIAVIVAVACLHRLSPKSHTLTAPVLALMSKFGLFKSLWITAGVRECKYLQCSQSYLQHEQVLHQCNCLRHAAAALHTYVKRGWKRSHGVGGLLLPQRINFKLSPKRSQCIKDAGAINILRHN